MISMIRTMEELALEVGRMGILPFFKNRVPGWSLEERIDPGKWFTDDDGPWEWKGPLASQRRCVYGKFIRGKAAFVSPGWFGDLANWRRDGYAWDERLDEDPPPYRERLLMDYLQGHPLALSKYARRECGFAKGYDAALTRLEMQTYVVTVDFQYSLTRQGVPYGWGNAVIDLADRWLGKDFWSIRDERSPGESFERMIAHLKRAMPEADEKLIRTELK